MASCVWTLEDVLFLLDQEPQCDSIACLAALPEGAESLRYALQTATPAETRIISSGLLRHFAPLCCSRDGHKVILDLFAVGTEEDRMNMAARAVEEVECLSHNAYGCLVFLRIMKAAKLERHVHNCLARRLLEQGDQLKVTRNGKEVLKTAQHHCLWQRSPEDYSASLPAL